MFVTIPNRNGAAFDARRIPESILNRTKDILRRFSLELDDLA
jgi:hypothetical protein